MKKAFKIIGIGALALLILAAAFVKLGTRFVNTESFKRQIETYVESAVNRNFIFRGEIRFSLFPWAGLTVEDIDLENPEGFPKGSMLSLRSADIRVELMPLFKQQLVFKEILFNGAVLELIRNRDGHFNWEGLISENKSNRPRTGPDNRPFTLRDSGRLRIEDARVIYTDLAGETSLELHHVEFEVDQSQQHDFQLAFDLSAQQGEGAHKKSLYAHIKWDGSARFNPNRSPWAAVDDSRFKLSVAVSDSADGVIAGDLNGEVTLDLNAAKLTVDRLNGRLNDVIFSGNINGERILSDPIFSGRLLLPETNTRTVLAAAGIPATDSGNLRLPETIQATGTYEATIERFTITSLLVKLDEIPLSASLLVTDFPTPTVTATLKADTVDLSPYLKPAATGSSNSLKLEKKDTTVKKNTDPAKPASNFNMELAISINRLDANRVSADNFSADLKMHEGSLQVSSFSADMFGGHCRGKIGATPGLNHSWSLNADLEDIDLRQVSETLDLEKSYRGRLAGSAELHGTKWNLEQVLTENRAFFDLKITDGDLQLPINIEGKPIDITEVRASLHLGSSKENQSPERGRLKPDHTFFHLLLAMNAEKINARSDLKLEGMACYNAEKRSFSVADTRMELHLVLPDLFPASPRITLDGTLNLMPETGQASLSNVSFSGFGISGNGGISATDISSSPDIRGKVHLDDFNPGHVLRSFGLKIHQHRDPNVMKTAGFTSDFVWSDNRLTLPDIRLKIDDSLFRGRVDVFRNMAIPSATFNLKGDRLDLTRYLPVHTRGIQSDEETRLPVEFLTFLSNSLDLTGKLSLQHLTVKRLQFQNVSTDLSSGNGRIAADPFQADFYGGKASSRAHAIANVASGTVQAEATVHLADVQLHPFLTHLVDRKIMTGTADIDLEARTSGLSANEFLENLDGDASFNVAGGTFQGFRIISARENRSPVPKPSDAPDVKQQPFKTMGGSVQCQRGILTSDDIDLTADRLTATGRGYVNLVDKKMHYIVTVDILALPKADYHIQGPFEDIRVYLNKSRFATTTAADLLKSPFSLGKGTLNLGQEIFKKGSETIGDDTGAGQIGTGVLDVGKGVLEIGKGAIEWKTAPQSVGKGAAEVGKGVLGVGKGAIGFGKDALGAGASAVKQVGDTLKKLFNADTADVPEKRPADESQPIENELTNQ